MIYRQAQVSDIAGMQVVRHAVKENRLSDPGRITDADNEAFICKRGRGWVCEIENKVVGFSIVDLQENNIWALFLDPDYEGQGIGKELHRLMLDWYFSQTKTLVWLGTSPNTRAEKFYKMQGWRDVGIMSNGEVRFEMSFEQWMNRK
jgi:GNAT superfamily N-acetyltransferase